MSQWEYKVENIGINVMVDVDDLAKNLDRYGAEGWELVSVVVMPLDPIAVDEGPHSDGAQHWFCATFKRMRDVTTDCKVIDLKKNR
jgi:phage terminase large subunit GpA-like protein